ncbi:RHS repeat domain-containing protein [Phaeocystidibacter marisrubri]|uniref:RHS repeat-associated core domain-containing protein n=1 Tax=Phaeocystidibacter marisrubri TaxID=1577780 RepID=A0A6L3ZCU1_9FLAO|nr:RHS repeat-associated core domain-containing protein [Phaeocystidibacter marisrubri]KAB2815063.1 RHS repeat-associated core domain-containing protein [Phaeocystidibacter marisrubri]GGH70092.1 hypothetical protein GCM10011318_11800 [Phaeocystidibacter marisrubri]
MDGTDYNSATLFDYNTLETLYPEFVEDFNSTNKTGYSDPVNECCFFGDRYWYHPDYLGSVAMVTNDEGVVHQFFLTNAWGEELHTYNNANTSSFNSEYRFNDDGVRSAASIERCARSAELDEETGLAYYGARYYDNKISMWLSVDPLAMSEHNRTMSPYQFTDNNPINLVDPDGREIDFSRLLAWDKHLNRNVGNNILQDLQDLTGLNLEFDENGVLISKGEIEGVHYSEEARELLLGAINSTETVEVTRLKPEFDKTSKASLGGYGIFLLEEQITDFIKGTAGLDDRTMGYGMIFLHELDHTALGQGVEDEHGAFETGPVVDRMNKIRGQMSTEDNQWGQRLSYDMLSIGGNENVYFVPFSSSSKSAIERGGLPYTEYIRTHENYYR